MSAPAPGATPAPPPPGGRLVWLAMLAWLLVLAWLPWWLDLPLLLALAAVLLVDPERLGSQAGRLRSAIRWGLPGLLFAVQRALGSDALAWAVALVGALVGFTLLAGLESWLDRDQPRERATTDAADWPELARAPIGPGATLIELQPVCWQAPGDDPNVRWQASGGQSGRFLVDGTSSVDAVQPRYCATADGSWFAAPLARRRGVVLLDRKRGQAYRLQGWTLYGWHGTEPWLQRNRRQPPVRLRDALGEPPQP